MPGKCPNESGQTLVEFALVGPLFLLVLLVCFTGLMTCYNAVELQSTVSRAAPKAALGTGQGLLSLETLLEGISLLGRATPPVIRSSSQPWQVWRPNYGIETVQDPGQLITVKVSSRMIGIPFFSWRIASVPLNYWAQFPQEPAIPAEE